MMTTNEMRLLDAMRDFRDSHSALLMAIASYEEADKTSVNDLPNFVESYPFHLSLDELAIDKWLEDVTAGAKNLEVRHQRNFKVVSYEYLNTGGNTMVGIHEVWLPDERRTVYVYTNEEGATISLADYIRNEFEPDDYDEVIHCHIDWGTSTGNESYFELYRHCLGDYIKDDCKHFGYKSAFPYHLLNDELQQQVTEDYLKWLEAEGIDNIDTNGEVIFESQYYHPPTEDEKLLEAVREFQRWHDSIAADEKYYDCDYTLTFADKKITLPFVADVWDAVDHMLTSIIKNY